MALITVKHLYKVFGKQPEKALALLKKGASKKEMMDQTENTVGINNVSFEVHAGESFVVMGLSGSGKSTLIRCLNRLIDPTSGSILIDDNDITTLDKQQLAELRRSKVSMVFQSFALFPHMTISENVEYGLKIKGLNKAARQEKAIASLKLVGLEGWEQHYPDQLSGGMQQRVGLARALATDPDILLMDEAFSALDPLIRKEMQSELIKLQQKMKKTIIFITHDLDEALNVGDRIALMKDGEIVQIGTPEEIVMAPATSYVKKFVENVDRSKMLTAEMIMITPAATVVYPKDGPRIALHRMQKNNISSMFVLDSDNKLLGIVMAEDALQAVEKEEKSLESIINQDVPTVLPDTTIKDMFSYMTGKGLPLAVVDNDQQFQGLILRGTVMAKLAEGGMPNG